jgi:hypothetical protein
MNFLRAFFVFPLHESLLKVNTIIKVTEKVVTITTTTTIIIIIIIITIISSCASFEGPGQNQYRDRVWFSFHRSFPVVRERKERLFLPDNMTISPFHFARCSDSMNRTRPVPATVLTNNPRCLPAWL